MLMSQIVHFMEISALLVNELIDNDPSVRDIYIYLIIDLTDSSQYLSKFWKTHISKCSQN